MKTNIQFYRRAAALIFFAAFIAGGCVATSVDREPGQKMPAAPLPEYTKGTTFVYSNGSWETVMDTAPGEVIWINHQEYVSTGSPDFTRRRKRWQKRTRQGTREFTQRQDVLFRPPLTLWPLTEGKVAGHTETGSWSENGESERSYRTQWRCEVEATERVSVMAGEFDTYRVVCRRYHNSRLREKKTWYYAPEVEHYVLRISEYYDGRSSRRLELLAILPSNDDLPPDVRRLMEDSFQQALESNSSGHVTPWSAPRQGISGKTLPTGTFQLDNGIFCRRYVQQIDLPDDQRIYYGMSCRDANGRWIIPRR